MSSLERAVELTHKFSGKHTVHIILAPGLYPISHRLDIKTAKISKDTIPYLIQAQIMPDDPYWQPGKTPVIQANGNNNLNIQFIQCAGFFIEKDNVSFLGLKFTGNANPNVDYYYPIRRDNPALKGINVSQCYFVGEKNSAPIQSAFWVCGANVRVDHSIFYNCKNAFVLGKSTNNFSLSYSIVSGSYESAIWHGYYCLPFTFTNNIVTNCNYLMVHRENEQPAYTIRDSYIAANDHYLGFYPKAQDRLIPVKNTKIKEIDIRKSGVIQLVPVKTEGLPHDYLNLSKTSIGKDTHAGIFKNK